MKYTLSRLAWMRLPALALVALLQRAPALRLFATAEHLVASSPIAAILKSAIALASLGAVNTLAGATEVISSGSNPLNATVGQGVDVVFGVAGGGAQVPGSWRVGGTIPPGLRFGPRTTPGDFNDSFPSLTGTPTTAGTYTMSLRASREPNQGGPFTDTLTYQVIVAAAANAPVFSSQPTSATVNLGQTQNVTFTASATDATSYQWRRNGANISGATSSSLTVAATEANAGSYTVVATSAGGSTTSNAGELTVVTLPPVGSSFRAGGSIALNVAVANSAFATYQWSRNGTPISGATGTNLIVNPATSADAGSYTVTVTKGGSSVQSAPAIVALASAATPSRLSNLSVRTNLGSGQTLILGFVTSGSKNLITRAVGPGLNSTFGDAVFPISSVFANPMITLFNGSGTAVAQNDDWDSSLASEFSRLGAFPLVNGSRDSGVVRSINGQHTAHISGTGSGIVLVELYDAESASAGLLKNVSARNIVGTGADVLISGFVIEGSVAKTVLIRGIGPGLQLLGIPSGFLADPKLDIFDRNQARIAENNDWDQSLAPYFTHVGAFNLTTGSKDSGILITLDPGPYTVQLSGVNSTTGDGFIEVYEVE